MKLVVYAPGVPMFKGDRSVKAIACAKLPKGVGVAQSDQDEVTFFGSNITEDHCAQASVALVAIGATSVSIVKD